MRTTSGHRGVSRRQQEAQVDDHDVAAQQQLVEADGPGLGHRLGARIGTFFPFWAPFTVPIRTALGALPCGRPSRR